MLPQHSRDRKQKRGRTKYRGISTDAEKLGVTRTHLWRVLEGERQSPLLRRYHALKKAA